MKDIMLKLNNKKHIMENLRMMTLYKCLNLIICLKSNHNQSFLLFLIIDNILDF